MVGILATAIFSIWAINDARKQVRQQAKVQRDVAWVKVQNDLVWLFVDPTDRAHSKEVVKGLSEFALLSKVLDPRKSPENLKRAAENEALDMAERLVAAGSATWKPDLDREKARSALSEWRAEKDVARAKMSTNGSWAKIRRFFVRGAR